MGGLISALATWIGASSAARFLALKVVLYALFVVVLPIVLWNFGVSWTEMIMGYALQALPTNSFIYNMVGLAGWFAATMNLELAINTVVSALATRMLIDLIARI